MLNHDKKCKQATSMEDFQNCNIGGSFGVSFGVSFIVTNFFQRIYLRKRCSKTTTNKWMM
jgi:hypothetical protein